MAYLIVKCEELGDQWECDADRKPMCIVEDYKTFTDNIIVVDGIPERYRWEAYPINDDNTIGDCVKHYDESGIHGMVFVYYPPYISGKPAKIIKEYPKHTRYDEMPKKVKKYFKNAEMINDELKKNGHVSWFQYGKFYVYGEYVDDFLPTGC